MPKVVISDTSSLIVLTKIDEIELLKQLYQEVVTTPEIVKEFGDDLPSWVTIIDVEDSNFQKALELQLDKGEASAIALSQQISDAILILDDLKARKVAKRLGLIFTGTLGVLGKAKGNGLIPSLKPIVDKLEKTNFRISKTVLSDLLKKYGE